jgi:hypothetical protein
VSNPVYHNGQADVVAKGTTNYAMFKFSHLNRRIDPNKLEKLYNSVVTKNLLREFPILVDEQFCVIDGQHRLKVAESLGVPVYYIVSKRVTIEDVVMTTANVTKWSNENYLDRWCAEGYQDYIDLRYFWQKYKMVKGKKFLSLGQSMHLCHYGDLPLMNQDFQYGRYKCNDMDFAEKVARMVMDFSEYITFWNDKIFLFAVSNLAGNAVYDHARMMRKMAYMSTKLVKCPDMQSYMDVFTYLYNYQQRGEPVALRKLGSSDPLWRSDKKSRPSSLAA